MDCEECGLKDLSHCHNDEDMRRCHNCHAKHKPDSFKCKECGNHDAPSCWIKGAIEQDSKLCLICGHWVKRIEKGPDLNSVRFKGSHFEIVPDTGSSAFRGYGGARFVIHFKDGRVVETHNLWHQGDIPQHFRDRLPDNANQIEGMNI